jgi:hypothetical protein
MMDAKSDSRAAVYAAIDSERDYQDQLWGVGGKHEIDAFATYIRRYSTILDQVATEPSGDTSKLDVVRKIAGLCVACMEQHGAPTRLQPYETNSAVFSGSKGVNDARSDESNGESTNPDRRRQRTPAQG